MPIKTAVPKAPRRVKHRRFTLGSVRFSAMGGRTEGLLSFCAEHGIRLEGIAPMPGGFSAEVSAGEYRVLHAPARRCRIRLRVQKRRGPAFAMRWLFGRPGLVLGALLFLLAVRVFGGAVWAVRFVDLPTERQDEVRKILCEADMAEGSWVTPQKLEAARRLLQNRADSLGWVALNFANGRLVVETTPALVPQTPPNPDMTELVAAENATVLANHVQGGFAVRVPGQTVAKGEVLIAASRPDRSGNPVWRAPQGTVTGLLQKSYAAHRPLSETARFATGRVFFRYALKTPAGVFALPGERVEFDEATARQRQMPLAILGIALPAMVRETIYFEMAPQERRLNETAAREFARYACRAQLFSEFPDAEVLAESPEETWSADALDYRLTVQFRANIAVRAEG